MQGFHDLIQHALTSGTIDWDSLKEWLPAIGFFILGTIIRIGKFILRLAVMALIVFALVHFGVL